MDSFPHPEVDWKGFVAAVEQENKKAGKVWSPITKQARDWVDTAALSRCYKKSGVCTIM